MKTTGVPVPPDPPPMEGRPREDIVFAAKDEPLRCDVHELGALVGAVIAEQGGAELFRLVEAARQAAIRRRQREPEAEGDLVRLIGARSAVDAGELVRAFSTYFRVVNRVEQAHRIRRRRDYDRDPLTPPPGGLRAALRSLRESGVPRAEVAALLGRLRLEPVFTAHPTEATRRTVLIKEQQIARLLIERDNPSLTPPEHAAILGRIGMHVATTWQTDLHPAARPTVENEREHVLYYLLNTLYEVVPAFYEAVEDAMTAEYGRGPDDLRSTLCFGSWVGGDMDGNPNVSGRTIRETLAGQRQAILVRYRAELVQLADTLTQSEDRVGVAEDILDRLAEYARRFPDAMAAVSPRHREMPYRVLCLLMIARLEATEADEPGGYATAAELEADLDAVAASLVAHRGRDAGLFVVRRALRRVRTFGFHLATLDVRQDAGIHRAAVAELLGRSAWPTLDPVARAAILSEALVGAGEGLVAGSEETTRTLDVFRAIQECRDRYGARAIGPFVVSMAHGPDDVLSVLYLGLRAGLTGADGAVPLDVAPLFETVDDLRAAPGIMTGLFDAPGYAKHLAGRGGRQMVMIGYSDSAKDGGIGASRWSLHGAEAALTGVAEAARVDLTLFHGRGGTVSRGGGRTHRAVLAAPPGSVNGRLRFTEQGEAIDANYGLRGLAFRTLERIAGAVMLATSRPPARDDREPVWAEIMDALAAASREAWRALVYLDPAFDSYFRQATPIDVIERMTIGSRPPSRRAGGGIESLRAIPWVFAWTQSRHMLSGWYGLGTGLDVVVRRFGRESVAGMVRDWPFVATMLEDVEMVLARADLPIAARYADLAGPSGAPVFARIKEEFDRTVSLVVGLRGTTALLDTDPTLARAIRLRNPYVDPMSFLQIDLLRAWRAGDRQDPMLLDALLETVNGIAQGLQHTG